MNKKDVYIVIPGCCDLNRGDQALGWETVRIAKESGYIGEYNLLAEEGEPVQQSANEGYDILTPILQHPSRKFSNKSNIVYNKKTKIKWGLVAIGDLLCSLLLLNKFCRNIYIKHGKDKSKIKTLLKYNESKAIFMKGGGLIQSHGGLLSTYATYYRLYHIFLAHAFNKPVYILPNSFGPFEGPFVKHMVKLALNKCKLVTAREKKSQEVVKKELGIDIPLYPDLAFFLPNGNINRNYLCNRLNIPINKPIVAITVRPYRFPNSNNPLKSYNRFKQEIRKFIYWLYKNGFAPLIIEHTFAITSHENDGDCIRDIIKTINSKYYYLLSDRNMNCKDLKAVYGSCDYIIGTRFHSMIFSLCNKVPGIAISYDGYKSIGIMQDIGLKEYVVDIGEVSSEILEKLIIKVKNNRNEIVTKIDEYIEHASLERIELVKQLKGD